MWAGAVARAWLPPSGEAPFRASSGSPSAAARDGPAAEAAVEPAAQALEDQGPGASADVAGGAEGARVVSWKHEERYRRLAAVSARLGNPDPDRKKLVDEVIRVDHAGETSAVRIYEGQMAVLKHRLSAEDRELLAHMLHQEEVHLRDLNKLIVERRVRPSLLLPLWEAAGFALGASTALLGKEAAMACTVAVETTIGGHYNDQIRTLLERGYDEEELLALIKKNRDEELEHLNHGLDHGAENAPLYSVLSQVIQTGCKAAIEAAKRV